MSYRPQGASLPTRFRKPQQSNYKSRPKDLLCVVDAYELKKSGSGSILVTEVDTNRKIEVSIKENKAISSPRSSSDKWNGNLIDARMQNAIPEGSRLVLDSAETVKKIQKNGEDVFLMNCNWIASIPDQSPEKSFTGIITVNKYTDHETGQVRISGVQVWDENSINPDSEEGEAAIDALGDKMDEVANAYRAGERPVSFGVRFRTLVESGKDRDGNPTYQVIDSSPPFDWIKADKDSEGNIISPGHPMDKEHLEEYLGGYLDYVYGSEDQDEEGAEPGLVARGIISEDKDIIVEVSHYRAFQAAPLSKFMQLNNENHPLYRMANVMTRYGQLDENSYIGKNYATQGIVVLTGDQAPKTPKDEWKERNLVNRIFPNGFNAHLDYHLRASDGGRCKPHPALDRIRDVPSTDSVASEKLDSGASMPDSAPRPSTTTLKPAAQVAFDDEDEDDNDSYFAQAVSSVSEAQEVDGDGDGEQEQEQEQNLEESTQQEQDTPAKTGSKPAKKGGASRFRRST